MILLLDTSTPICRLALHDAGELVTAEWEAGRALSKGLLDFIQTQLTDQSRTWSDISGIAVFKGPGSFTGLRIGITVANTLAESLSVPIVGQTGDDWIDAAISRLQAGENDRIVLPEYGADAHITTPRK